MWTVFIADDEPKTRRRLGSLISSAGAEFIICGEAGDGVAALERIREELPDILLVDISMPRMNGLDFIEQIREEAENCIVIVITGHDEFDYARRAVELPIFEYVLKPVDSRTLRRILDRATSVLAERRTKNELLQWASNEVRRNRDGLIQELFDDWIQGFSSQDEINDRKMVLHLDATASARLLAIQLNARFYGGTAADLEEHHVRKTAVNRLAEIHLGDRSSWIRFEDRYERLLYMIFGELTADAAELIRKDAQSSLNIPLQIAVGDCRLDYEGFVQDYEVLTDALEHKGHVSAFMRKFVSFLDEEFGNKDLSLELASDALALSPAYVSRLLKQNTGYGFSEFTNRYRVCKAMQLLRAEDKMIYEVADEVGYASQHYFTRMFTRIAGRPPGDYRKSGEVKT